MITEGSLEVKLPTVWTDEKHSQEEAEPGRNSDVEKWEKIRGGESQKREDAGAEKVGKSRNTVFPPIYSKVFQSFKAPQGRKVGSLERRVRSQRAR